MFLMCANSIRVEEHKLTCSILHLKVACEVPKECAANCHQSQRALISWGRPDSTRNSNETALKTTEDILVSVQRKGFLAKLNWISQCIGAARLGEVCFCTDDPAVFFLCVITSYRIAGMVLYIDCLAS